MNTILIDILVAIALVGAGAFVAWHHEQPLIAAQKARADTAEKALADAIAQRAVDQAASARLVADKATIARKTTSQRAALTHAVAASPSWADAPVPKEVQDALKAE